MKKFILAALWLSATPVYQSSMGNGGALSLFGTAPLIGRSYVDGHTGMTSAGGFKDRNAGMDLGYPLTERLDVLIGVGYDRYDLYGAGPTVTRDVHTTFKLKLL